MEIINLQYHSPEGRLAEYHGAILADEFQKRGMDATKMVIGDPATIRPESRLLSILTVWQRTSSRFWIHSNPDIVLTYCSPSVLGVAKFKAIKEEAPNTVLVARIEGEYRLQTHSFSALYKRFVVTYVRHRHGHFERHDNATLPAIIAALYAILSIASDFTSGLKRRWLEVIETVDWTTYVMTSCVEQT